MICHVLNISCYCHTEVRYTSNTWAGPDKNRTRLNSTSSSILLGLFEYIWNSNPKCDTCNRLEFDSAYEQSLLEGGTTIPVIIMCSGISLFVSPACYTSIISSCSFTGRLSTSLSQFLHSVHFFFHTCLLPKLKAECLVSKPHIVCITESWLDSNITDNELCIDGYSITRLDRNRHGKGVALYVSFIYPIILFS